jgi:secretion/DNA translocation related TadE-like protein
MTGFGVRNPRHGNENSHRNERGAVTVLAVAVLALAVALAFGVARLGHAAGDDALAQTAADAAALAAAGAIARNSGSPSGAAAATAASNGARLVRCDCAGPRPSVVVTLGDATARARAEVRYECFADPTSC